MMKLDFKKGRTLICAVVNITPDSFSDGGLYLDPAAALKRALECRAEGADLVDIGAESSRPGSAPVPLETELARLLPAVRAAAAALDIPVSVDTYKPEAARACLEAGASYINDITGFSSPAMISEVASRGAGAIVMHMRGSPGTMQKNPVYRAVTEEVAGFLAARAAALKAGGVSEIILDPGIGFGKTLRHNLELISRLGSVRSLGYPVMLGVSRKAFIGELSGASRPDERLPGTIAACVVGALNGADIVRVHDVAGVRAALAVADALRNSP
ncbi:MAG: dihydropteroate synthase [Elusimicrobiales bacterium]|jgi:dihydropteroate synthase